MSTRHKNYIDLINACDRYPYEEETEVYKLFLPDDHRPHGLLRPEIVRRMPWTAAFEVDHIKKTIHIGCKHSNQVVGEFVNESFAELIATAIDADTFEIIHGRHSEPYLVPGANFFCHLERFSHALFGIVARGAHMTAYTRSESGEYRIWVPRRARHLFTYPEKLDSTVAGGIKATDTPFACILAEAQEEASLDESFVREHLRSVGTLTYVTTYDSPSKREHNLISPEILYVYDLELSERILLKPCDDEVERFNLMSVDEVQIALRNEEFKTNSAVVMIDFFIRHGIITQENEPLYAEIISRMHRRLPIASTPSL